MGIHWASYCNLELMDAKGNPIWGIAGMNARGQHDNTNRPWYNPSLEYQGSGPGAAATNSKHTADSIAFHPAPLLIQRQ